MIKIPHDLTILWYIFQESHREGIALDMLKGSWRQACYISICWSNSSSSNKDLIANETAKIYEFVLEIFSMKPFIDSSSALSAFRTVFVLQEF